MNQHTQYDVIIVGGSYAGLAAAMALGRSLRNVLIIDGGMPCNQQTPQSHNFITHDGETPAAITASAKAQVLNYKTITFVNDFVIAGLRTPSSLIMSTQKGGIYFSKKLIIATGIKDIMPDIKGFADCWGISVIHCPYCHGYEFKNKKTALFATGERAMHLASLIRNLSPDLTIIPLDYPKFTADQLQILEQNAISVVEEEIEEIKHENGQITAIVFKNGSSMAFEVLYASLPFEQSSELHLALDCKLTETGYFKIDPFQQTTVDGVYACGDNSGPMRSVAQAVASGNLAGAMVNMELCQEEFYSNT